MLQTLLQFESSELLGFILAGLLLNLTPGVDFLLVTSSAISGGAKVGRAAAVGINLGVLVHVVMAALGFSALLYAYPIAYKALLYLGAAYLLSMAYRLCFSHTVHENVAPDKSNALTTQSEAIKRGFLTNVLNPKTALFVFAFIPQFTNPAYGPMWQQVLILGLIFLINGFVFVLVLATAAGSLSSTLRQHIRLLNKLTAVCFCLLALRLIINPHYS